MSTSFNVNHVVQTDDPIEMFRLELSQVGATTGRTLEACA